MSIWGKIIGRTAIFVLGEPIDIILVVKRENDDTIIRNIWIQLNKKHHLIISFLEVYLKNLKINLIISSLLLI